MPTGVESPRRSWCVGFRSVCKSYGRPTSRWCVMRPSLPRCRTGRTHGPLGLLSRSSVRYVKIPTAFRMKISRAAPSTATTQPTMGPPVGQSKYAGQPEPQARAGQRRYRGAPPLRGPRSLRGRGWTRYTDVMLRSSRWWSSRRKPGSDRGPEHEAPCCAGCWKCSRRSSGDVGDSACRPQLG
jgi:hypothetical protein